MRSKAILVALLAFAFVAQAAPVSERQAQLAARAWAAVSERFGTRLGSSVEKGREFAVTNGASFFSVKMKGGGAVIVSGDSEDAPIIAMSSADISNLEEGSPLRDLVERDILARRNAAPSSAKARAAQRRWLRLISAGDAIEMADDGRVPSSDVAPTDLRVPALVESKWGQQGHGENYYTPNKYVCGCVATAMAQIMRYHCFPVKSVAQFSKTCTVDNIPSVKTAKGGVYDWDNMPLVPSDGMSDVAKEAIGRLTYDCGVSVSMGWAASGSRAFTADVGPALTNLFGYANAKVSNEDALSTDEALRERLIFASLDAGYPVQLGICQASGANGHSIVADGYGYIDDVSYVHLNMGWSGLGDIWYHLPDVTYVATSGGSDYTADIVSTCVYNIFPTETGVVLSGRTLDDDGEAVAGASVAVYREGESEPFTNLTSSASGVYAAIVSAGNYIVSAVAGSFSGDADAVVEDENVWGCDVVVSAPAVRVMTSGGEIVNICSTLDRALREAALLDDPIVEIFAPTILKRDVSITNDCRIVAGEELSGLAPVERRGGAAITVDGATAVFSGILFSSASEAPVMAVNGGVAAFAGTTSVSETLCVEADSPDGFALAGDIEGGIRVRVEGAMDEGDVFGFAMCDLETAQANAAKIMHPEDPELGGEAFVDPDTGDVKLRWANVPVDPSAAVASWRDADGEWHHERSFDTALSPDAVEIVLKKSSPMSARFAPSGNVAISIENGAVLTVNRGAQFVAGDDAGISFSGIVVRGGTRLSASLVSVEGGAVEMAADTVFEGVVIANSDTTFGTVVVKSGTFTMKSDTMICGCGSDGQNSSGCNGGGVYVCADATFDMQGGTITECTAQGFGGGVYADAESTVLLSGDASIFGNTAPSASDGDVLVDSDLYRKPKTNVQVAGLMTGRVGVAGKPSTAGAIAVKGDDISDDDFKASANAFFSDVDADEGYVRMISASGNLIVWNDEEILDGPFPVAPEDAVARVIRAGSAADYWATFSDAFRSIDGGTAIVELLTDCVFGEDDEDIEVFGDVTLRTADDYDGELAFVSRAGQSCIYVGAGSSLTVEGVYFYGFDLDAVEDEDFDFDTMGGGDGRLFDVNGGDLTLSTAFIFGVYGDANRAAAAIVVHGGGTATLDGGSFIYGCKNTFVDTDTNSGAAAGIVAEDEGTSVYLRDCNISYCYSRKTGGVFIGNKASIYISGNANVVGNSCDNENSCGNMVVAEGGHLYLDGELTGFIGYEEGIRGDERVFGTVTCELTAAVRDSATNFVHDVTRARGAVSGTDLVWDLDGRTKVAKPEALGTLFTYDGTLHTVLVDGEGYSVTGGEATDADTYHAVARLDPGYVWDDEDAPDGVVSFDWEIVPAALSIKAGNAWKFVNEDDPYYYFNYTVTGLVDGDDEYDVVIAVLIREEGEEEGTYIIDLNECYLFDKNYSFDYNTSFTPGVFTIYPESEGQLEPLDEGASLEDIKAALEASNVQDPNVAAAIEADPDNALDTYNSFCEWAQTVAGGAAAVCASEQAWVSYEFGVTELFENEPTVIITSIEIEDPSIAAMRVTLEVKDGDVKKDVDPDAVAALFEMSTDLKVWSKDLTANLNEDGSFTVKPNDPTQKMAVIRLKY